MTKTIFLIGQRWQNDARAQSDESKEDEIFFF